jgi:hypothetical protein
LQAKIGRVIADLDSQEKELLKPNYIRPLLFVLMEEKEHNLEEMSAEIDGAVEHYLKHQFDVFVHDEKLDEIGKDCC